MVRNYKRKTNRCQINEDEMKKALADIKHQRETATSAAEKYGLKRTTLIMRLKKQDPLRNDSDSGNENSCDENFIYHSKYTSHQTLTRFQEEQLVEYAKKCAFFAYGLSYDIFKRFVYEFVAANNIPCPSSWETNNAAGESWLYGFLKRNPSLTLRKPEKTSLARLRGFTKSAVEEFFQNLSQIYANYSFEPKDIYNLDETGITTVMDTPKVLTAKGQRSVAQVVSAERGSLVTMVGIMNACGNHLPPVYVFPRIRANVRFSHGCFPGSLVLNSKSGWMVAELFTDVLKHIQKNSNCSKEQPILILLDNHASHCSLESIIYCRDNGITLLSFPPHTSHRLQPLDVEVFGPFKRFCKKSFSDFMITHHGKQISIYDVAKLTHHPFEMAFTPNNILSGFKATGIYPFSSQIFMDNDFLVELEQEQDNLPVIYPPNTLVSTPMSSQSLARATEITPTQTLTPEDLRPIARLAPNITQRSGSSRILTSSPEKNRALDFQTKRTTQFSKRSLKSSTERKKTQLKQKSNKNKRALNENLTSSDESVISVRSDSKEKFINKDNCLLKFSLLDDEDLNVGEYVLVNFGESGMKPFYYTGEIEETFCDSTYNINYLRRLSPDNWVFVKPVVEDISITLRSEIEFKLPTPNNPASTSRSRAKYLFDVNFGSLNIK